MFFGEGEAFACSPAAPLTAWQFKHFFVRTKADLEAACALPGPQQCQALVDNGWVAFIHAQAAADVLQTRMFLFCSLWRHWLDRAGGRVNCPALAEALPAVQVQLQLSDREVRLLVTLATPTPGHVAARDRVSRLLFHGTVDGLPAQANDRRLRGCLLATVAVALGTPGGQGGGAPTHILHTHLVNPGALAGTFGLAGGHDCPIGPGNGDGAIGYDCSSLVNLERKEMVKSRDPIAAPGVFSSLFLLAFGSLAVSLAVFPEHCSPCRGPVFTDFYAQDECPRPGKPAARSPEEWLRQQVWQRVEDAWVVLRGVTCSGDDAALVAMGAISAYRALPAAVRPPTFRDAASRRAFEERWRDQCFQPVSDRVRQTRQEVGAFLRLHPCHAPLAEARAMLPNGDDVMPRLVDCVATHAAMGGEAKYEVLRTIPSRIDSFKHLKWVP
jgi:hypothetical protein